MDASRPPDYFTASSFWCCIGFRHLSPTVRSRPSLNKEFYILFVLFSCVAFFFRLLHFTGLGGFGQVGPLSVVSPFLALVDDHLRSVPTCLNRIALCLDGRLVWSVLTAVNEKQRGK